MELKKDTVTALGLMSGTSLDGLDLCYAAFNRENDRNWQFEIIRAETIQYDKKLEQQLRSSISMSAAELAAFNVEYGFYLGEQIQAFLNKHQLSSPEIIGSHGHTVFHQPERKFTVQIGDGRAIRQVTGTPVVYDFRMQDVLLGGNGAPLVPIGDELLFSDYQACLNLGGFSNISFIKNNQRLAFDICPVNIVLNSLCRKLGQPFDHNGDIARNGEVNCSVLEKLNAISFYNVPPPKSLGIEWVQQHITDLIKEFKPQEAIATITEHAAFQIASVLNNEQIKNVLITGGGSKNQFLIERIRAHSTAELILPELELIDFKEALIFGFMAVLRLTHQNNVLSSATGSAHDHCTGILV